MGIFDGCLIACDVDGTLMYNGVIPEINKQKIKFFVDNGGIFALATGRSVGAVSSVTSEIDGISASVVTNGCMIYDYSREKILYEVTIPDTEYASVLKIKDELPEIGIEVHSGMDVFVLTKTKETDDHEFYEGLPSVEIDRDKFLTLNINKVLYALNNISEREAVRKKIGFDLCDSLLIDTSATLLGGRRDYLEQIPKNASKSKGVLKLAEILKIKKGSLFAIGDYYNDLDMLKIADISCAPIDSPEEIRQAVTYVATNAENGAVADFIDYLTDLRRK